MCRSLLNNYLYYFGGSLLSLQYSMPPKTPFKSSDCAWCGQGWDLGLQKEKVRDEVTLETHLTCLGVLQKELEDKAGFLFFQTSRP